MLESRSLKTLCVKLSTLSRFLLYQRGADTVTRRDSGTSAVDTVTDMDEMMITIVIILRIIARLQVFVEGGCGL